jgi:hypothetical protein
LQHLLIQLLRHGTCCCLSGSFVNYLAGVFHNYMPATLFIAMDSTPIQNLLFKKGALIIHSLQLYGLSFEVLRIYPHNDICVYRLSKDHFSIILIVVGIDATIFCRSFSNVDFVHFVWDHLEKFAFKIYSITIIPTKVDSSILMYSNPTILYLRNYRADSEGLKNSEQCVSCETQFK